MCSSLPSLVVVFTLSLSLSPPSPLPLSFSKSDLVHFHTIVLDQVGVLDALEDLDFIAHLTQLLEIVGLKLHLENKTRGTSESQTDAYFHNHRPTFSFWVLHFWYFTMHVCLLLIQSPIVSLVVDCYRATEFMRKRTEITP